MKINRLTVLSPLHDYVHGELAYIFQLRYCPFLESVLLIEEFFGYWSSTHVDELVQDLAGGCHSSMTQGRYSASELSGLAIEVFYLLEPSNS